MTRRVLVARWVLPISQPPIEHGAVVVDGETIAWVGPSAAAPDGVREEFPKGVLLPGLVNAHAHLELTGMRGLLEDLSFREWILALTKTREKAMHGARRQVAARCGVAEGLLAGITSFGDVSDTGDSLDALRTFGARGVVFREVFGPAPGQAMDALKDLSVSVERLRQKAGSLLRVGVSPHAPYTVSDDLFAATAEFARREGYPLTVHLAESQAEHDLVVSGQGPFAEGWRKRGIPVAPRGQSPVELLGRLGVLDSRPLLVHCVRVNERDMRAIATHGAAVVHCPASNAKLGHGIAPICALQSLGITIALGSDSVASSNRMDLLDEGRLASLFQRSATGNPAVLPASDVLRMATLGGAKSLGLESVVGSLEPGKAADVVVFSLDGLADRPAYEPEEALVFGAAGRRPTLSLVAGRDVVRNGRLLRDMTSDVLRLDEVGVALTAARRFD